MDICIQVSQMLSKLKLGSAGSALIKDLFSFSSILENQRPPRSAHLISLEAKERF